MPPKKPSQSTPKASLSKGKKKSTKTAIPKNALKRKVLHDDHVAGPSSAAATHDVNGRITAALPRRPSGLTTLASIPASADPLSPLEALRDFFGTRMSTLRKGAGHTTSTHTRTPGFFDKHLEEIIRLKRVMRLPTIPNDLMAVAEQAVQAFPAEMLPSPYRPFPEREIMSRLKERVDSFTVQKEADIQTVYSWFAERCAKVAGTLAYPNSGGTWDSNLLAWTPFPMAKKNGPAGENQATPDGILNFNDVVQTQEKQSEGKAPITARPLIATYEMNALVLDELKNLNFCEEERMNKVVEEFCDGQFPWACCELGAKCCTEHWQVKPTLNHVGWDAKSHSCQSMQEGRERREAMGTDGPFVVDFSPTSRNILQQAWASAVRYDATFIVIYAGNMEIIAIRDRQTQTFYLSDVIQVDTCDNYLQMHVGLYIAAIRDAEDRAFLRATTKEVPPTWTPPGSTKTLDLTYITGHEETRSKLLEEAAGRMWLKINPTKNALYHPFTQELYHRVHTPEYILPMENPPLSPTSRESSPINSQELYMFLPSPTPTETSFLVENYGRDAHPPQKDTYIELQADFSFYKQRTCRGSLRIRAIAKHPSFSLAQHPILVVKNASEPDDIASLQKEYHVINSLRDKDVQHLPQIQWFFHCPTDDPGKQFVALILEDMGISLYERQAAYLTVHQKRVKASYFLSSEEAEIFVNILESWHRAGYIHGKLSVKSLMFKSNKGNFGRTLSIVGFKYAECVEFCDSSTRQEMFRSDMKELRRLIGRL